MRKKCQIMSKKGKKKNVFNNKQPESVEYDEMVYEAYKH